MRGAGARIRERYHLDPAGWTGGGPTASGLDRQVGSEADERSHPMGKLTFIAGLAAGYVLGARAGRERYDQNDHGSRALT